MGMPESATLEQMHRFAEGVMPHFKRSLNVLPAQTGFQAGIQLTIVQIDIIAINDDFDISISGGGPWPASRLETLMIEVKRKLRIRAAEHGCSMEAEASRNPNRSCYGQVQAAQRFGHSDP